MADGNDEEDDDDEVPDLVENFDEPSKNESATTDQDKISEVTEEGMRPLNSSYTEVMCFDSY